jgi:hypothetical protein
MAIGPATVRAINEAIQGIPLSDVRVEEVPVELNQLHDAAVVNRARLDFDAEPSAFVTALHRAARG